MPLEPIVSPHTIVLKGDLAVRHEEARAGAAINPGYLLKMNNLGQVIKHPTAGLVTQKLFAKEDALHGFGINDAYATNDLVSYHIAQAGDMIYAKLAAGAAVIAIGDPITSAGDGTLKKATGSDVVEFTAKQAIDNSAGGSETFFKVEVN